MSNTNTITISRVSPFSGQENLMVLPMSEEDYFKAYKLWKGGALIQNAFPTLSASQREFVKTGITPLEWKQTFGED